MKTKPALYGNDMAPPAVSSGTLLFHQLKKRTVELLNCNSTVRFVSFC